MTKSSSPSRTSRHSSLNQTNGSGSGSTTPLLLRLVDIGLLSVLFAVPFALGGHSALGQLILVACTGVSVLAWGLHQIKNADQQWVPTRSYLLLLGGVGLGLLQIVSLSPETLAMLSPHQAKILPLWHGEEAAGNLLGSWTTLSLTPEKTLTGLVTIVSYCLLFVVAVQRIRTIDDAARMVRWVACVSFTMALFGLVQYLTSNGKYYWFLEHYQGTTDDVVLGAFPNRNHFAQLLALGFAPVFVYVLGLLNQRPQRANGFGRQSSAVGRGDFTLVMGVFALATVVVALMCSLSRGGMLSLIASVVVCLAALYWKRAVSGKIAGMIATVCLLIGGILTIHGDERIASRFDRWDSKGRREIWEANAKVIADFPLFGTGIGSHRFAHKLHWDHPELAIECAHAESSLVQITSESGLAGLSLVVIGVVTCFGWCVLGLRRSEDSQLTLALAAVAGGLSASVIHSVFDVVWHTPGIMVSVVVLAACACRLYQLATASASEAGAGIERAPRAWGLRLCGAVAMVAVVLLSGWAIPKTIPRIEAESAHLDYLMLSHKEQGDSSEADSPLARLEGRLSLLERAVELSPENSDLQRHLAYHYYSVFEVRQANNQNPMSAAQIQDAVIASQFQTTDELQAWLDRAIGENAKLLTRSIVHARKALALCPLHASAYVQLAELGFLEDPTESDSTPYLEQARLVDPNNAYAQFASGQNAWREGQVVQAIAHWKVSFRQSGHYRQRIIGAISENLSARFLLDNFEFDWKSLEELKKHYQALEGTNELSVVLTAHARGSIDRARRERGSKSAQYWLAARDSLDLLNRPDLSEQCLVKAHRSAPHTFAVRMAYGKWLLGRERFAEASEHLTWCARRKPSDVNVGRLAERAVKGKIQHADMNSSWKSDRTRQ